MASALGSGLGSTLRPWTPGALYGAPLRWTSPRLAGRSDRHHVALTLDDGPDPLSTPQVLRTLARHEVRATYFLVGEHIAGNRALVERTHAGGHDLAVHGWTHRSVVGLSRQRLRDDLERTCAAITQITGTRPRWYRPPFGITTLASRDAARDAGLTPVLWTAWGRDWSRWVGPAGITRRVELTLRPGGTVLLHDTDRYASPGSWRRTDAALDTLLTRWASSGVPVGPLAEHWSRDEVAPISRCRPGPAGPPSP